MTSSPTTLQKKRPTRALLQLATTMRLALKSKTHDRRWRKIKVYKDCFLHADAVEWMMQYLQQQSEDELVTEEMAVAKLNELVDAGYVSHVCHEHRFKVQEKSTLFFRFLNGVIDLHTQVLSSHKKKKRSLEISNHEDDDNKTTDTSSSGDTADLLFQQTDPSLQLEVERLAASVKKYGEQLDEAHGKIVVLEEAVAALGFACVVAIFCTCVAVLCRVLEHVVSVLLAVICLVMLISMVYSSETHNHPSELYYIAKRHVSVLVKLMRPVSDMEDAFMEDVEKEDETCLAGRMEKEPLRKSLDRRSVFVKVKSAISRRALMDYDKSTRRDLTGGGAIKMREAWDLPDESTWPHRPVMLCVNTPVSPTLRVPQHGTGPCPLGVPFEFSSDLFEGKCLVRLRDVPSDNPESDSRYFLGRRRKFQSIIQGRFKKPLKVSDVLTGHEFARPLKRLPPSWMVRTGTNLIRRLAPGAQIVLEDGQQPHYALAILAATSQTVSADMPGNEPNIATENDVPEDLSLLGGIFGTAKQLPAATRKRHLSNPQRAAQYEFDTESVYTFDFYQQLLDVGSYSLDLGFTKLGLCKNLDGQPIQVMAKTVDGDYLWNFQLWHEDLLSGQGGKQ